MKFIKDFKAFVMRGNVVDLAFAVMVGAAFGAVVNSFVTNILMPPIGLLVGGINFNKLAVVLRKGVGDKPDVILQYGIFVDKVVTFLIISLVMFVVIRLLSKFSPTKEADPTEKDCPECCMAIPIAAKKCCHCTSIVD